MRSVGLLLLCLLPQQQPRKLEWKLAPGREAVYAFLEKNGKPSRDRELAIFGSELTTSGNRFLVDRGEEIPLALLFQLPPDAFKSSAAWEHTAFFFQDGADASGFLEAAVGFGGLKPLCARGRYAVKSIQKKGDDEVAVIDGAFTFYEIRRDPLNAGAKPVVTKNDLGTLAVSAQVSLPRGLLLKGGWQLKLKGQERVVERGVSRVAERAFAAHEMIELKEERALVAEDVAAAATAAVKKASDFLLRRGAWGNDAALVLHALLEAGTPPEDPLIIPALKALKAAPLPQNSFDLARSVLVFAKAGMADDARRLAEELAGRRDLRSGVWGTGQRNDNPNPVLTATAVAALAAVDDAKVPEDAWRSALEAFTSSWIEDGVEVDLAVVFEADATTIVADPKKNVPATWPADAGRRGGGNNPMGLGARKGSAFVVLAALETCLKAPAKLKLDEKQKQAADLALRKGLTWLQSRWTLRAVPPAEGAWSLQRHEYLGRLGRVLARAKVDTIAGADWRLEGSTLLLREQGGDGSWAAGTEQTAAKTAHALLFLGAAKR